MPSEASPHFLPVPSGAGCPADLRAYTSAPVRAYRISYQLKLATLCYGKVTGCFFVPASRRFDTDELNVILAELSAEVGPAPHLLGLEIFSITRLSGGFGSRPAYTTPAS